MKLKLFLSICSIFIIFFSCQKDEIIPDNNYASELSFEIAKHLVSGQSVKQIEFSQEGYFYSVGKNFSFPEKKVLTHFLLKQILILRQWHIIK